MAKTKSEKGFEDSLKQLEEVVGSLEAGNLSLDDSIKLFEKGVKLGRDCEAQLKKAEEKIATLKESLKESTAG